MVTQDVDFVVATDAVEKTVTALEAAGFTAERFQWSINFRGRSKVSIQLSIESHAHLWALLSHELRERLRRPETK
jgi:hypothetical protein